MFSINQFTFIGIVCLGHIHPCNGGIPSPETIGKLFGYPSDQLLIEETTSQERTLLQTPSRRDQKRQTVLPDPAILLESYDIRGKSENSFFPIHVYIGKKHVFLTADVLDRMTKGDALPLDRRFSGTDGFASIGRGGWYFADDHKVKANTPPLDLPLLAAALIIIVQPQGQEFDIKIARRAALLDQGAELQLIPGGEAYFNTFGPTSEPKSGLRLDRAKIFPELTRIVIAEWLGGQSADGLGPTPPHQAAPTPSNTGGIPPAAGDRRVEPSPPQGPSKGVHLWAWLVVVVILCGAVIFYNRRQ